MWRWVKVEGNLEANEGEIRKNLSPEEFEKLKNQWFSMEKAIEELAENDDKLSESTFCTKAEQVNRDKEIFELGKPQVKE